MCCPSVALSQVLHPVAELPVLCHVLRAVQGAQHTHITVVVSRQSAAAIQQARRGCQVVDQVLGWLHSPLRFT